MGGCCSTPKQRDPDVPRCAGSTYPRNPDHANQPQQYLGSSVYVATVTDGARDHMEEANVADQDLRQISLGLYQYLCRHVVGTEDTVRTKRLWNTLTDNVAPNYHHVVITSGSFGEGLEMKGSDLDYVYVLSYVGVSEEKTCILSNPDKEAYFQIMTDDRAPGIAKLFLIKCTNNIYIDLCEKVGSDLYLSNECFKKHFSQLSRLAENPANDKFHGPCLSDDEELMDRAYCLHSSSWIRQASRWMSRSNHSWPSNELKARIIEHGTLFVPVGVKGSQNEKIQWRISFNVGEKLLIYSFTHTQLLCYALMKIVLKDLINTDPECKDLLCSYFIKNIMFWISEELPLSMWRPDNLVPCFMRCLERLIYCVEYSRCVHYFIPENNMFENRIEGEKRHILLDKLHTLHSFNWQCILLSHQLQNIDVDHLNLEAHLFDVHFQQIVNSFVIYAREIDKKASVFYPIRLIQSYKSPLIGHPIMRILSELCYQKALNVRLHSKYGNKKLYRRYKTCQCYLMQGLRHNAVSGWLMVSSMFYRMKKYKTALDILIYVLEKCSPEKVFLGNELSSVQVDLLKSEIITNMGLEKALSILYLERMYFDQNSHLIPKELEIEVRKLPHILPPVVYGHFLSFLCQYHLHDTRRCRDSISDLILTIYKNYFIHNNIEKAASFNCLGVANQLIGNIKSAKRAFLKAINLDTKLNSAEQRLSKLENP